MQRLRDLKVRTKLFLAFALLAAVVLLVSSLSMRSLGNANQRLTGYLDGVGRRERLADDIRSAATRRAIAARNLVLVTLPSDRALEKEAVDQSHAQMITAVRALGEAVSHAPDASEREVSMFHEIERIDGLYAPVALGIVAQALANEREAAIEKMNVECRPLLASLMEATRAFIEFEQVQARERVEAASRSYESDRRLMWAVCGAAVALAVGLGWILANAVTRPLHRAVAMAEAVAAGDLGSEVVIDRADETGQLLAALQKMNQGLLHMVSQVRESADGIAVASSEIALGNQDLSGRTEHQASALQQTAASMHQITEKVQDNAQASDAASRLAESAVDAADRGGAAVQRVVETMAQISQASQRISDITGVIDGIAFQTNILALNAAVEAARAGQQGLGFAVVAGEVRNLAQRAAEAAREIKSLIGNNVAQVETGGRQVAEAGATIGDAVSQVRRMSTLINEINDSTGAQSVGIAQVNQAVASIDVGTQQNSALVEQSAAAAESLKLQAANLMGMISVFRLQRSDAPA